LEHQWKRKYPTIEKMEKGISKLADSKSETHIG